MFQRPLNIFTVDLPVKRPFHWRFFLTLVALYFLGNLAGVPLLRTTNVPIEPVWFWGVATTVSALMIALSLAMASRTSLGAPLLEGRLSKEDLPNWLRSGLALTVLMLIVGFPFSLIANLNAIRSPIRLAGNCSRPHSKRGLWKRSPTGFSWSPYSSGWEVSSSAMLTAVPCAVSIGRQASSRG